MRGSSPTRFLLSHAFIMPCECSRVPRVPRALELSFDKFRRLSIGKGRANVFVPDCENSGDHKRNGSSSHAEYRDRRINLFYVRQILPTRSSLPGSSIESRILLVTFSGTEMIPSNKFV